jgi:hypothetical protein
LAKQKTSTVYDRQKDLFLLDALSAAEQAHLKCLTSSFFQGRQLKFEGMLLDDFLQDGVLDVQRFLEMQHEPTMLGELVAKVIELSSTQPSHLLATGFWPLEVFELNSLSRSRHSNGAKQMSVLASSKLHFLHLGFLSSSHLRERSLKSLRLILATLKTEQIQALQLLVFSAVFAPGVTTQTRLFQDLFGEECLEDGAMRLLIAIYSRQSRSFVRLPIPRLAYALVKEFDIFKHSNGLNHFMRDVLLGHVQRAPAALQTLACYAFTKFSIWHCWDPLPQHLQKSLGKFSFVVQKAGSDEIAFKGSEGANYLRKTIKMLTDLVKIYLPACDASPTFRADPAIASLTTHAVRLCEKRASSGSHDFEAGQLVLQECKVLLDRLSTSEPGGEVGFRYGQLKRVSLRLRLRKTVSLSAADWRSMAADFADAKWHFETCAGSSGYRWAYPLVALVQLHLEVYDCVAKLSESNSLLVMANNCTHPVFQQIMTSETLIIVLHYLHQAERAGKYNSGAEEVRQDMVDRLRQQLQEYAVGPQNTMLSLSTRLSNARILGVQELCEGLIFLSEQLGNHGDAKSALDIVENGLDLSTRLALLPSPQATWQTLVGKTKCYFELSAGPLLRTAVQTGILAVSNRDEHGLACYLANVMINLHEALEDATMADQLDHALNQLAEASNGVFYRGTTHYLLCQEPALTSQPLTRFISVKHMNKRNARRGLDSERALRESFSTYRIREFEGTIKDEQWLVTEDLPGVRIRYTKHTYRGRVSPNDRVSFGLGVKRMSIWAHGLESCEQ